MRIALARIASLRNDYDAASKYYREAVTLMPDDKNLRRSYAEALFYANQFASAAAILETIRKQSTMGFSPRRAEADTASSNLERA